jgi:hypothetical protein
MTKCERYLIRRALETQRFAHRRPRGALALSMQVSYRVVLRCLLEGLAWLLGRGEAVQLTGKSSLSQAPHQPGREVDALTARGGAETPRPRNHTGSSGAALAWDEPRR